LNQRCFSSSRYAGDSSIYVGIKAEKVLIALLKFLSKIVDKAKQKGQLESRTKKIGKIYIYESR